VPANQNIEGTFAAETFSPKSSFMSARIFGNIHKTNIRNFYEKKENYEFIANYFLKF
jgi:hypothetical protein